MDKCSKYEFKSFKFSSHKKLINFVYPNSRVLDVGCSKGYIARELKKKGCSITGIDINKEDLREAKKYCDRTILGDITKKDIKEKFDVIILGDIIEHVVQPLDLLKKLRKNLDKGGYILISTPNIVNIYPRLKIFLGSFDYEDIGFFDRTHLRFFTLKTFKKMVADSGYSIVSLEFTPIPIYLGFPNISKTLLKPFYYLLNIAANIYPRLFAYQFVAKIK
jgi:2-polyprenyl-3-methyl-5-hydroxy-6-metoxy-1,4-benzoquinol methylase